jgi:hypothetical protein
VKLSGDILAGPPYPEPTRRPEDPSLPAPAALGTVPGAAPLLVALVAFALAALALRMCAIDDLEDEHAAPACVGRCS